MQICEVSVSGTNISDTKPSRIRARPHEKENNRRGSIRGDVLVGSIDRLYKRVHERNFDYKSHRRGGRRGMVDRVEIIFVSNLVEF